MRKIFILSILYLQTSFIHAQQHTNWLNYSYNLGIHSIDIKGNDIWITTLGGGLVKYNKILGEKTHYNRANSNLPDNNLLGLFCAENGDIWVGGRNYGIGKYNGENCIVYNEENSGLPFNQLNTKIKVDKNDNVWIASFRWMGKYDGNEWKTWETGSPIHAFPVISDFEFDSNGTVWLYSTDGLGKIENGTYSIIPGIGGNTEGSLEIDKNGTIWIGRTGSGLYKYNGDSITNYSTNNSCIPSNYIYSISFDQENNMWLATSEGLVSFTTEDCEVIQPLDRDKSLYTLYCDDNHIIWCASNYGKFFKFDGSNFSTIDLSNSPLKSNYAFPLFADNENNVWISSTKNTLITKESSLEQFYNKKVNTGVQDKNGAIWLAFNSGDTCLLKISGNESLVFDSVNSPFIAGKTKITHIIVDSENTLWISSENGIYKYDGTSFENFNTDNSSIPCNSIWNIALDSENNLWVGSAKGLIRFDGMNWTVWNTTNSSIPSNWVNSIIIDSDNTIWFSSMDEWMVGKTYGGGLIKFDGQTMTVYNIDNSGLLSNTIYNILDDGDKLWLATYGAGLMNFNKIDKWKAFNVTNSGIASNIVQGVIKDKNGSIWMGHMDAGISVFIPDSTIQTTWIENKGYVNNANQEIFIYPNPVKNELFVDLNLPNEEIIEAKIYDIKGKLIQVIPRHAISIDNSIAYFQIKSNFAYNQILILSLKTNNNNVINKRFLYSK